MATYHQERDLRALRMLHTPHPMDFKCIHDVAGQMASSITFAFADREAAEAYAEKTGAILFWPYLRAIEQ